jgi:phthiodiolone/phenolphthiodiolone dimycocerosates ketoreductase
MEIGMYVVAKPPLGTVEALVGGAQGMQLDSVFIWDHLQDFFPSAVWDEEFSWLAGEGASPHEWFEYQTLLGYLAAKFPDMRLGVGVTEPLRRHPMILAQAALTLAHLSRRPPILGLGSGERVGAAPCGLDFSCTVSRLEEALLIIRRCFATQGPFDFAGEHFQLQGAVVDLPAPEGRTPEIWIAAHGPRMLRLTGQYGDGWYPVLVASPEDYAARLDVVRTVARETGRDPEAITPAMHPPIVVAPTEEEARAMLDTRAIRFFGLLLPAEIWGLFGVPHPFGERFRGFVDIMPETYDRQAVDAAIEAVPREMIESLIWGTPDKVVATLREFGEAGLRHVVPLLASAVVSPEAAAYSVAAMAEIAAALCGGQECCGIAQ